VCERINEFGNIVETCNDPTTTNCLIELAENGEGKEGIGP